MRETVQFTDSCFWRKENQKRLLLWYQVGQLVSIYVCMRKRMCVRERERERTTIMVDKRKSGTLLDSLRRVCLLLEHSRNVSSYGCFSSCEWYHNPSKLFLLSSFCYLFVQTQTKCIMDLASDAGKSCLYAADREGALREHFLTKLECYLIFFPSFVQGLFTCGIYSFTALTMTAPHPTPNVSHTSTA